MEKRPSSNSKTYVKHRRKLVKEGSREVFILPMAQQQTLEASSASSLSLPKALQTTRKTLLGPKSVQIEILFWRFSIKTVIGMKAPALTSHHQMMAN